jgi:glutathione S-transferase
MPMTIYGVPFSPYVARVVLAAGAKGLKYKVEMPADGFKSPAFLKMNPFGKMPILVDGGVTLFESSVIVEYLEAKGKGKALLPKGAKAAAAVRLLATISDQYVQPLGRRMYAQWKGKCADQDAQRAIEADLAQGFDALERRMAKAKYAAGARFSLADVYIAPTLFHMMGYAPLIGIADPLAGRKKLATYWQRLQKDKLVGALFAQMRATFEQIVAAG